MNTDRLSKWEPSKVPLKRKKHTVRPYDKRNYQDPVVDALMSNLPPFHSLSPDLRLLLGDGPTLAKCRDYGRSRAFPLAQSFDEDSTETRKDWEWVIGLNGNGFPCHYRRNVEEIRQRTAKIMFPGRKNADITPEQRKESWKITRRLLRELYHVTKGTKVPVKGTTLPESRLLVDIMEENLKQGLHDLFIEEEK